MERHHVACSGSISSSFSNPLCKEAWPQSFGRSATECLSPFRIELSLLIIYLFLKHRKRGRCRPVTSSIAKVTIMLPIFNEVYVVERLLRSVSEIDIRKTFSRSRCSTIRTIPGADDVVRGGISERGSMSS